MTTDERYPDAFFLAEFERRLAAGEHLSREESLALIAELRRMREEHRTTLAALAPLNISIVQSQTDPQPDEWFYQIGGLDGGPVAGRLKALRMALAHWRDHCDLAQQEGEALYPELLELRRQVAALQRQLDATDAGDGLEPWRRAFG